MRSKLLILTFLYLFFGVGPVFADSVLINEIMANPANSEKEWVELYNSSAENINLTQWAITELTASGNTNSHPLPSVIIPSLSSCFFEFTNSVLNNNGDTVSLSNSSGSQIDSYTYTSTTQGKTFSRVPDGETWQAGLTDPTKSNIACNNLLSPIPSFTPTPTPAPSTTSTSTPQPSTSLTISNTPSQINSDQSFTVSVNLTSNTAYYCKGAFKKPGSSNYFGFTKVAGTWIKNSNSYTNQYPCTNNFNLEIKPDIDDSGYTGNGDYIFKVGSYDKDGVNLTWSNEVTIKINDAGGIPSNNPSPQSIPRINPAASSTKPESPTPKPTSSIKTSYQIASVAGIAASATPEEKVEIKNQKQFNPFVWIGIIFIFAGAGLISYIYLKRYAKIRNKF